MGRKKTRLIDRRIEPLRSQIERWRQTRGTRSAMAEPLWRAAVELAREHGVYATAQALHVSYGSLRTRTEADASATRRASTGSPGPQATFVELPPAVLSAAAVPGGTVVEVVRPSGQRLTVQLRGGELDLAELIRACWSGRA